MLENSQLLGLQAAHLVLILDVMFVLLLELDNAQLAPQIIIPSPPNVLDVLKVITQLLAQTQRLPVRPVVTQDAQLVLSIPQSTNVLPARMVTTTPVVTKLAINVVIPTVKLAVEVVLQSVLLVWKDTSSQAASARPAQQVLTVVLALQLMQQHAQLAQKTIT